MTTIQNDHDDDDDEDNGDDNNDGDDEDFAVFVLVCVRNFIKNTAA